MYISDELYHKILLDNRRFQKQDTEYQKQNIELQEQIHTLNLQIDALKKKIASLSKNSQNSSKSPSSDIVKPPKKQRNGKKRKIGAQPGHKANQHRLKIEDADCHITVTPSTQCPYCLSHKLVSLKHDKQQFMQYELVKDPVELLAYTSYVRHCKHCKKTHYPKTPNGLENLGFYGPRLSSLIVELKSGSHASYSNIQEFLKNALGCTVAQGTLCKVIQRSSMALKHCYEDLSKALPQQERLNIDETGYKENGKRHWAWVLCAKYFSVFHLNKSRSTKVLEDLLGKDYEGLIGCDFYAAYRKYMREARPLVQFCLAHLIRELKHLQDHGDVGAVRYANYLLSLLKETFAVYHDKGSTGKRAYAEAMSDLKREFLRYGTKSKAKGTGNFVKRLRKYGDNYFLFITEDVEPTNNIAERTIRSLVIDRKVTQGIRGKNGQHWWERIWSVRSSCKQQSRNSYEFVLASLQAWAKGVPGPSLLPTVRASLPP